MQSSSGLARVPKPYNNNNNQLHLITNIQNYNNDNKIATWIIDSNKEDSVHKRSDHSKDSILILKTVSRNVLLNPVIVIDLYRPLQSPTSATQRGVRTHDPKIKGLMPYRLRKPPALPPKKQELLERSLSEHADNLILHAPLSSAASDKPLQSPTSANQRGARTHDSQIKGRIPTD